MDVQFLHVFLAQAHVWVYLEKQNNSRLQEDAQKTINARLLQAPAFVQLTINVSNVQNYVLTQDALQTNIAKHSRALIIVTIMSVFPVHKYVPMDVKAIKLANKLETLVIVLLMSVLAVHNHVPMDVMAIKVANKPETLVIVLLMSVSVLTLMVTVITKTQKIDWSVRNINNNNFIYGWLITINNLETTYNASKFIVFEDRKRINKEEIAMNW